MGIWVKDKGFYKLFFTLAFTIALQNLVAYSVNLCDNIMLGNYTQVALSGATLVNQIQFFLQLFIGGIGNGLIVMASRYWGKKDTKLINNLSSIAMFISVISAVVLWAIVFFFPIHTLMPLSDDMNVVYEGVKYMQIVCFSYIFFAITNVFVFTLRSVETVRIGMILSLTTLCINMCLNYLLIYGNFGAPELGIRGAAIATLTSRIIETVIIITYVKCVDSKLHIKLRNMFKLNKPLMREYIKVGLPVILGDSIWALAMAAQTAILGHMGSTAIAANSIATTVFQIVSVVSYGAASASAVVIGRTIGEGNVQLVKRYAYTMQILFLIIGCTTGFLLFICKDLIINFYTISIEAKQLAVSFMTVLSITVIGTSYQMACNTGIIRGGGDTKFVFILDMIFMWGIVLPSAAVTAFVFNLPPLVVFICLKSDQVLKCFISVIKVNRFKWIKNICDDKKAKDDELEPAEISE